MKGRRVLILVAGMMMLVWAGESRAAVKEDRTRILVLGSNQDIDSTAKSLEAEIQGICVSKLMSLNRHEVIDRAHLDVILKEQALMLSGVLTDSVMMELGQISSASEALIVTLHQHTQKGVPPDDDATNDKSDLSFGQQLALIVVKGLVEGSRKKDYSNNIQTYVSADVNLVNLESGQVLGSFTLEGHNTGGSAGRSMGLALKNLGKDLENKLKEMFLVQVEVVRTDVSDIYCIPGSEMGVKEGSIYVLRSSPDTLMNNGKIHELPGRRIGFIKCVDVSPDLFRGKMVRQNEFPAKGATGQELLSSPRVWQLETDLTPGGIGGSVGALSSSLSSWYTVGGLGFSHYSDSRNSAFWSFVVNGAACHDFPLSTRAALVGGLGSDISIMWRKDDAGHSVTAVGFAIGPEAGLRFSLKEDLDLLISGGFHMFVMSDWEYSEDPSDSDSKLLPAVWTGSAPDFDNSGAYIRASLRFWNFQP